MPAEPLVRLGAFVGVFVLMTLWEVLAPRRPQAIGRRTRWPGNLGVVVVDTLAVRVLFPAGAVGMAMLAQAQGWGLLNVMRAPGWVAVPLSVLLLDLAIYAQHVAFHHVPVLWRLHRMHHADLEFDVTTGVRFHPVEIVLSMLIKSARPYVAMATSAWLNLAQQLLRFTYVTRTDDCEPLCTAQAPDTRLAGLRAQSRGLPGRPC